MRMDVVWAGAATLSAVFVTPDSVAVFIACCAGTYATFGMAEPLQPRSRMWQLATTCVIMGCAFSVIASALVDYFTKLELTTGLRASIGAVLSFLMRFWLPSLVDAIKTGEWKSWVPFLNRNK